MSRLEWWPHDGDGPCLDPGQMAAFADGGLGEDERSAVTRHLAGCSRCYQVFAGTIAVQDELAKAETGGRAALSTLARYGLAAAAVLACVAVGAAIVRGVRPGPVTAVEVLRGFTASVGPDVPAWPVSVVRGAPSVEITTASAFEIGVLLADLRALDRRGDREAMRPRFLRLAALLDAAGFVEEEAARARQEAATTGGSSGPAIDGFAQRLPERFDSTQMALGAWTEAGRLSALARDRAFFDDERSRKALDVAEGTAPDLRAPLATLRAAWPAGRVEPDWPRLAASFESVARARVR